MRGKGLFSARPNKDAAPRGEQRDASQFSLRRSYRHLMPAASLLHKVAPPPDGEKRKGRGALCAPASS